MMCVRRSLDNIELKGKIKEEMEKWEKCWTKNNDDSKHGHASV